MTNNTVPNVSRELLERASNLAFQTQHYPLHEELRTLLSAPSPANHVEDVRAMVAAPSPASVDGLNTDRNAAFKACPESGCDWGSFYLGWKARGEVEQAIIDGLRREVADLRSMLATVSKAGLRVRTERDQLAQRIGELEGLLRDERAYGPLGVSCQNGVVARCVCRMCRLRRIDAALSAGKEVE